jgi:hypothetical protein
VPKIVSLTLDAEMEFPVGSNPVGTNEKRSLGP